MNLKAFYTLTRFRINRTVMPEAKRFARQALLGLKKLVGENLIQLIFRLMFKELVRDVLERLISLIG